MISQDEYPLAQLQAGQHLTIRSPNIRPTASGSDSTESLETESSATYTISNLKTLVKRPNSNVFVGRHSKLGRIAVKAVRTKDYAYSIIPKLAQNFENEIKLMSDIDHVRLKVIESRKRGELIRVQPSIIKFRGSDARLFSIYMEHLNYPDLSNQLDKKGFFNGKPGDAKHILEDMASALDYIHGQGISHNDIKPGNIIFDRSRGAVLIDFGLSRRSLCDSTGGTPWYVPRGSSQKQGAAKRDIFAMGVTMLYLLRETRLPEREPQWNIFKAKTDPDSKDHVTMTAWLDKIEA